MTRAVVSMLMLTLLVVVACTPSVQPPKPQPSTSVTGVASTSVAPVTIPTPDWSRFKVSELTGSDPQLLAQAEMSHIAWLRDASGIRAELGNQADDIIREMDQARALVIQDVLTQIQPSSKPKGMPAPLRPPVVAPVGLAQTGYTMFASMLLLLPIDMVHSYEGDAVSPRSLKDENVGDAQVHSEWQLTIAGSSLEIEVEMTTQGVKDGVAFQERGGGKIRVNLCPDAQGEVPLDLTYHSSEEVAGHGYQFQITDNAIGHVDEEGTLVGYDQQIQVEDAVQSGQKNEYAQVNMDFKMNGVNTKNTSVTDMSQSVPRSSSNTSREFIAKVSDGGISQAMFFIMMAFDSAEKKWQNGYCVAVLVADGTERVVPASSETPFTATVRHKFEGKDLTVPVIATLTTGKVSVTPSGAKVPAPATFRYKAPDKGGETATVELVSRSRRGTGRLTVAFKTQEPLAFELEFNSVLELYQEFYGGDGSYLGSYTHKRQILSTVPLLPQGSTGADRTQIFAGEAVLDNRDNIVNDGLCSHLSTLVSQGHLKAQVKLRVEDDTGGRTVTPIEILIGIPGMDERTTVTERCPNVGDLSQTMSLDMLWMQFHEEDLDSQTGFVWIKNWVPGKELPAIATKSYQGTPVDIGNGHWAEQTTVNLRQR